MQKKFLFAACNQKCPCKKSIFLIFKRLQSEITHDIDIDMDIVKYLNADFPFVILYHV